MKLTPEQRREKIYTLAQQDEEYDRMYAEYEAAKGRFSKLTDRLPKRLRNPLWSFPGMGYFAYHRMLTLICENMQFAGEE